MAATLGQWVHMVGIAGVGMSGIAKVLREEGIKVSGSDLQSNSITDNLEKIGVKIYKGHSSSNIKEGVDLLVISSAIPQDNAEVKIAREKNIPIIKRGQMLAYLVNKKKGIAVAGAHGKTTTTSMLYTALTGGGLDPTFIVGGEIQGTRLNAKLGKDDYFVTEADESDASFLNLNPQIAVVTNIENDHLDFYKSFERIKGAFIQFIEQVNPGGFALLYGGDECINSIRDQISTRVIMYGEDEEFDYYLKNWQACEIGSQFEIYHKKRYIGNIKLSVPGKHNSLNALAAVAVALEIGLDFNKVVNSLANFQGTKRRFQVLGKFGNINIVDDYAHHPTEIRATIDAAKNFRDSRLVVIFQPHRYSRTKLLGEQIGESFKNADLVIFTDIYSAGEKPIEGINGESIYQTAIKSGCNALYISNGDKIVDYILNNFKDNDLIITMGAGDIWKLGVNIVERLSKVLPQASQA